MGSADQWLIDGNNVMGSRPDRWWNDRPAAQARLTQEIAVWCRTHGHDVVVVFDGRPVAAATELGGGNLRVEFAAGAGRNAADHRIVELAVDRAVERPAPAVGLTVVSADRGLLTRLPPGVEVLGPKRFLELIAAA